MVAKSHEIYNRGRPKMKRCRMFLKMWLLKNRRRRMFSKLWFRRFRRYKKTSQEVTSRSMFGHNRRPFTHFNGLTHPSCKSEGNFNARAICPQRRNYTHEAGSPDELQTISDVDIDHPCRCLNIFGLLSIRWINLILPRYACYCRCQDDRDRAM